MNDRVEHLVETGGERLDVFLAEQSPDLSRSRIRKLIDDGHVTVDGRPGKASNAALCRSDCHPGSPAAVHC